MAPPGTYRGGGAAAVARLPRLLFAGAALAAAAAGGLPIWVASFSSPQYEGDPIRIVLSGRGLAGDFDELDHVSQYIGLRVPRDFPELHALRPALLALAVLLLVAAWARGSLGRWLRRAAGSLFGAFLAAAVAAGQCRLYALGHGQSHGALVGMGSFTPWIFGLSRVGNFHVLALPGAGGWLLGVALGAVVATVAAEWQCARAAARREGASHAVLTP
ncbi:MAG: hypothetical protein ACYDCL_01300 [Myxococcales bacterium]